MNPLDEAELKLEIARCLQELATDRDCEPEDFSVRFVRAVEDGMRRAYAIGAPQERDTLPLGPTAADLAASRSPDGAFSGKRR